MWMLPLIVNASAGVVLVRAPTTNGRCRLNDEGRHTPRRWNLKRPGALQHPEQENRMHTCAFCKQPVNWKSAWRGHEQRLYCNEFCAEDEDFTFPVPEASTSGRESRALGR